MSSGSIPDPHRWMDVACTCTFPTLAHEGHCKRGQAICDYCDEGIRREREANDQPDTTAPQLIQTGSPEPDERAAAVAAATDRICKTIKLAVMVDAQRVGGLSEGEADALWYAVSDTVMEAFATAGVVNQAEAP